MRKTRVSILVVAAALTLSFAPKAAAQTAMKLLASDTGWVLMRGHLYWTTDNGGHWANITPPPARFVSPASNPETIASVFFLDTSNGWAVLRHGDRSTGEWHFDLASTGDAGTTWSVTPVAIPNWNPNAETLGGGGGVDFIDPTHGWMNLSLVSSTNFDLGFLLSTAGGTWKYAYDANNNMTSITDPRNITYLQNRYDSNNRVSLQTLADNGTFKFIYTTDAYGNVTETDLTDPDNNVRKVTFNTPPSFPDGFVTTGTSATETYAAGTSVARTRTYQYQPGTNLIANVTDPLSHTTSFAYDGLGNTTQVTQLAGTSNAVATSITYDGTFSQPLSITDPLGHATSFGYDSRGNLTSATDPLGNTLSSAYDGEGRIVSATDPLGESTQFSYDGPDLASATDPLGRATQLFFDAGGRLMSVIDPLGHLTRYQYNPLNQIASITDSLSGVTSFTYDGNGNLLSVTDPKNTASPTEYAYDNMDRLQTRTDPLGNTESYQYDGNGNLTQFTDRRGVVTTYTYL